MTNDEREPRDITGDQRAEPASQPIDEARVRDFRLDAATSPSDKPARGTAEHALYEAGEGAMLSIIHVAREVKNFSDQAFFPDTNLLRPDPNHMRQNSTNMALRAGYQAAEELLHGSDTYRNGARAIYSRERLHDQSLPDSRGAIVREIVEHARTNLLNKAHAQHAGETRPRRG